MGRPRGFDEAVVVRAAAGLFAERAYDGISVDDLVAHLGVHRNSLYQTFGSKRGLYLAALRWHVAERIGPLLSAVAAAADAADAVRLLLAAHDGLDLVLLAGIERAPLDADVAVEVRQALDGLDRALTRFDTPELAATVLGLRLRARAVSDPNHQANKTVH
jgi:TetR/AcrR family transcriptional repressor of nem operon